MNKLIFHVTILIILLKFDGIDLTMTMNINSTEDIVNSLFSHMPSPPRSATPKRRRIITPTSSVSSASSMQKEAMLEAAFQQLSKEEDEWDKIASLLAEYMRNAVDEFPMLADEFRMKLLAVQVQKRRAEARSASHRHHHRSGKDVSSTLANRSTKILPS